MILPGALRSEVEAALSERTHSHVELQDAQPIGGGCISNTSRLTLATSDSAFLKWCRRGELPAGIFAAESNALDAIAATRTVRVPRALGQSAAAGEFDWLLLEWLEPARMTKASWSRLGAMLAELHRCSHARFGWHEANFIGSLPQSNEWHADWPDFWRTQRLAPQLEQAVQRGAMSAADRGRFDHLFNALDDLLGVGSAEGPSLLHGDLWSGNVHGMTGVAALIDPSIYYGHREVDLAMASLFGGFDDAFYSGYEDAWRLQPGVERRRLVYQLYYLLVHVNLFGGSYLASTLSAVRQLGF